MRLHPRSQSMREPSLSCTSIKSPRRTRNRNLETMIDASHGGDGPVGMRSQDGESRLLHKYETSQKGCTQQPGCLSACRVSCKARLFFNYLDGQGSTLLHDTVFGPALILPSYPYCGAEPRRGLPTTDMCLTFIGRHCRLNGAMIGFCLVPRLPSHEYGMCLGESCQAA